MRATEELLSAVRDSRSRSHLRDAIRAYEAGAFGAAIISTWVTVSLDLVSKIREVADSGEGNAIKFVEQLDRAIETSNVRALSDTERTLLDVCRDDFELISTREHSELVRLRDDRHVCAHPAFVSADAVFAPTAELVRGHLAVAVDAVLRHGPTPGRKAIERFNTEIGGGTWPTDRESLAGYLRESYFERGRESLRINLAKVIVKGCLRPPDERIGARLAESAHALNEISPGLLQAALNEIVGRRERVSGLSEDELLRLTGSLGDLSATWEALPATSLGRVRAIIAAADNEELIRCAVFAYPVAEPSVADALRSRAKALTSEELEQAVAAGANGLLLPAALNELATARSYRSAEQRLGGLVMPLAHHLRTADIAQLAQVIRDNDQVRKAGAVPQMIDELFERTRTVTDAMPIWRELSSWLIANERDKNPEGWYAYPDLARSIAAFDKTLGTAAAV